MRMNAAKHFRDKRGKADAFPLFLSPLRGAVAVAGTVLSLLFFHPTSGKAQVVDSIRYYLEERPGFMTKLDTRHSFISSRYGRIFGLKMGLDHAGRVQYGAGFNMLLNRSDFNRELAIGDRTVKGSLNFWFISPFFEYSFLQTEHWELSMSAKIGVGAATFSYPHPFREEKVHHNRPLFNYEPILSGQYKFWHYFAAGGGIGYRLMGTYRPLIPRRFDQDPYRFTSPIYLFRFKIFFGKMYRDLFPERSKD
jgi:hypothetical protein